MRQSTALLPQTQVRLSDMAFPSNRVHIHRTRLAFIHLDNLLHFAKIDRDGRVDGFITAYLPDQVILLLMRAGDVITAVSFTEGGRQVVPIARALRDMREETERGELAYGDATVEQLAWMYTSCAGGAKRRLVDEREPAKLFPALFHELFSGVLELISNGRVSYFRFQDGKFVNGYYCEKADAMTVPQFAESLFQPAADGTSPVINAAVFSPTTDIPVQASPAMIETYRDLFWRITQAAEQEVPGEAMKRAYKTRDALAANHPPLPVLGTPLDREPGQLVTTADQLTEALAAWTQQVLEQLEIVMPGVAATVLKDATKEQRFMLQKSGFFTRLPWTVRW